MGGSDRLYTNESVSMIDSTLSIVHSLLLHVGSCSPISYKPRIQTDPICQLLAYRRCIAPL